MNCMLYAAPRGLLRVHRHLEMGHAAYAPQACNICGSNEWRLTHACGQFCCLTAREFIKVSGRLSINILSVYFVSDHTALSDLACVI